MNDGSGDRSRHDDQADGDAAQTPAGPCSCCCGWAHAASQGSVVTSARMRFSVRRRYAPARSIETMRVLVVEDEPYMAEAIRDGLRLEAIAADITGNGDSALE